MSLLLIAAACNSKSDDTEDVIVTTSANVAVKEFYLNANSKILDNLDSVFFSLDLDNGVIYNADSLPKGTDVSHLLATITFASTLSKADIIYTSSTTLNDTTIDYLTNPTDTIDFSYPVKLEVTAADETSSFTYTIKVNIHKMEPDSIMWDKLAISKLPSRLPNPVEQKTVFFNEKIFSLIAEYNATYTLSTSDNLNDDAWVKNEVSYPFIPRVESFCCSDSTFWILSEEGELFNSNDAIEWTSTGQNWMTILGGYMSGILGIKETGNQLVHCSYPEALGIPETPLEIDFPVDGCSSLAVVPNDWYPQSMAFTVGGKSDEGNLISSVWAFDGERWAVINDSLPALENPMLAHYVVYRDTPYLFVYRQFDAWLLFGGKTSDNSFNRTLFYSLDNGVTWSEAPELMQLPEDFPTLFGADLIVAGYELSADISDLWNDITTKAPGRWLKPTYSLDGYDINWICPYLYVFGGYGTSNKLSDSIWRGVLTRLTFTPII